MHFSLFPPRSRYHDIATFYFFFACLFYFFTPRLYAVFPHSRTFYLRHDSFLFLSSSFLFVSIYRTRLWPGPFQPILLDDLCMIMERTACFTTTGALVTHERKHNQDTWMDVTATDGRIHTQLDPGPTMSSIHNSDPVLVFSSSAQPHFWFVLFGTCFSFFVTIRHHACCGLNLFIFRSINTAWIDDKDLGSIIACHYYGRQFEWLDFGRSVCDGIGRIKSIEGSNQLFMLVFWAY